MKRITWHDSQSFSFASTAGDLLLKQAGAVHQPESTEMQSRLDTAPAVLCGVARTAPQCPLRVFKGNLPSTCCNIVHSSRRKGSLFRQKPAAVNLLSGFRRYATPTVLMLPAFEGQLLAAALVLASAASTVATVTTEEAMAPLRHPEPQKRPL